VALPFVAASLCEARLVRRTDSSLQRSRYRGFFYGKKISEQLRSLRFAKDELDRGIVVVKSMCVCFWILAIRPIGEIDPDLETIRYSELQLVPKSNFIETRISSRVSCPSDPVFEFKGTWRCGIRFKFMRSD